jgi:hypothetical protein
MMARRVRPATAAAHTVLALTRYLLSNKSAGSGLENRKPWNSSQLSNFRSRDCSSVSTPSATTIRRSACATLMMVDTSDSPSGPAVISMAIFTSRARIACSVVMLFLMSAAASRRSVRRRTQHAAGAVALWDGMTSTACEQPLSGSGRL